MKESIIFVVIIILIIASAIFFGEKRDYNLAPRKIWTYEEKPAAGQLKKSVNMCIQSWKKYNPNYEITILTRKNFFSYINIPEEISNNRNFQDIFPDLLRLWALTEHGGVWMDSTVLLKAPLDSWIFPKYAEFSGFYGEDGVDSKDGNDESQKQIQSWFMACNKNSKFIRAWRDEFTQIANYPNVEKYMESRKKLGITSPILTAVQKVLQIDNYPLNTLILRKSEDGPVKYLVDAKWNSEKALKLACLNKIYQTPIMRIRNTEQKILDEQFEFDLSPTICEWS